MSAAKRRKRPPKRRSSAPAASGAAPPGVPGGPTLHLSLENVRFAYLFAAQRNPSDEALRHILSALTVLTKYSATVGADRVSTANDV